MLRYESVHICNSVRACHDTGSNLQRKFATMMDRDVMYVNL